MPGKALIGYTGFVGGFLADRMTFTHFYRRIDIETIRGNQFDRIVCTGMPAAKWIANQNPEADTENTNRLMDALTGVETDTFVLISTVDVYQPEEPCDERTEPRPSHAYGQNRLRLERFVKGHFDNHHIIRLPALFGRGLRKNALYDLIHDNQVDRINPDSLFQWYDLEWLPDDIELCVRRGIREANLFTEPVAMKAIQRALFPDKKLNHQAPLARYDHKTSHPALHGGPFGTCGYRASADQVLEAMRRYVREM